MRRRGLLAHVGLVAMAIVLAGVVLGVVFPTEGDRKAIMVSAVIAFVLQLGSFVLLGVMRRKVMTARGIAAGVRLVALVVYALFVVRGGSLPANAALISLVVFLFLATLIEPLTLDL